MALLSSTRQSSCPLNTVLDNNDIHFVLVEYLTYTDCIALEATCKGWHYAFREEVWQLWRRVFFYNYCFKIDTTPSRSAEDTAVCDARPFGEQAIGWSLLVQDHHDDSIWREGVVVEYSPIRDCYRILYSDPAVQSMTRLESLQAGLDMHERPDGEEEFPPTFWESESHTNEYRARRGGYVKTMSRFKWLKEPSGTGHRAPTTTDVSAFPTNVDGSPEMPVDGLSWKKAISQLSAEVPSEPVLTIRDHNDEVLYADFSPCGKFLATASRDGSCNVYVLFDPLSDCKEDFDFTRTTCYDFLDLSQFSPGLPEVMMDSSTWRWASDGSIATRLLCKLNCGWMLRPARRSQAAEPAEPEREKLYPGRVIWSPDSSSILIASTGPLFWVDMRSLIADRGPPRLIATIPQTPSDVYGGFLCYPPHGCSNLPEEVFEGRIPLDDRLCVISCTRIITAIDRETGFRSLTQRFEIHARPLEPSVPRPSEGVQSGAAAAVFDINLGRQTLIRAISVDARRQLMVGLTGVKLTMMDQVVLVDLRNTVTVREPVPKSLRFPIRLSTPPVRIVDFSRFACCLACRFTSCAEGLLLNLRKFVNHALTEKFYEDPSSMPEIAPDLDVNMEALLLPVITGDADSPAQLDSDNITVMKGHHAYTTKSSPFIIMPDGVLGSRQVVSSGGEDGNVYTWSLLGRHNSSSMRGAPLVCAGRLAHSDTVNLVNYCPSKHGIMASSSDDNTVVIWLSQQRSFYASRVNHRCLSADSCVPLSSFPP